MKHVEGNTISPEILLSIFSLPLAYHHSNFLAATLAFISFSQKSSRGRGCTLLYLGCFGLDNYDTVSLLEGHTHFDSSNV